MFSRFVKKIYNSQFYALMIIVVLTGLVYVNSLGNDFTVDDQLFIVDWPLISDLSNWPEFFGPHNQPVGEKGVYSPLKTSVHALNFHFFGLNPLGYHLVAIFIHIISIIFVYKITRYITKQNIAAFFSGLFFGLHPVHVEAITFLTASIDTLGIMFFFVSFYYYIKFCDGGREWKKEYFISLIFGALAIFTHELVIVLPLLFLWYLLVFNRKQNSGIRVGKSLVPFFVLVAVYVFLKFTVLGSVARGGYLYQSFYLTMIVIVKALAKYVLILFFPNTLSLSHEISQGIYSVDWQYFDKAAVLTQSVFDGQVLFSLFLNSVLIYLGFRAFKKHPLISFCVGWFYICLIPVSNIIPTECYFAERYLYSGSLAFCLMAGVFIEYLYSLDAGKKQTIKNVVVTGAIVMICLFYSIKTYLRNAEFKDRLSLYKAEVEANPEHPGMNRDLGVSYLILNQPKMALPYLQKAVRLMPENADMLFALAECYERLNNYKSAIEYYQTAVTVAPDFAEAYYNLAGIYGFLGRIEASRAYLNKSIDLYKKQGKDEEANRLYKAFTGYFHRITEE